MSWEKFPELYQETARAIFSLGDQELGPIHYVPLAVTILVTTFALRKAGDWVDVPNLGYLRALLYGALGWAAMIACMVAFRILLPDIFAKMPLVWFNAVSGVLASMFIVIPSLCLLTRSRFQSSFMAWFISLSLALVAMGLADMAVNAFKGGKWSFDKGRRHNQDTMDMIHGR